MIPIYSACRACYNQCYKTTKPPTTGACVLSSGTKRSTTATRPSLERKYNAMDSIPSCPQGINSSSEFLLGYELEHDSLYAYLPKARTPQEAIDQLAQSPLVAGMIHHGMIFKVYRRVQKPDSMLWDSIYVGLVISDRKEVNK